MTRGQRSGGFALAAGLLLAGCSLQAQSLRTQDEAITAALNQICPASFDFPPIPDGLGPNLDRYCSLRQSFGLVVPSDPGGDSGSATSLRDDPRPPREALAEQQLAGDWRVYLSASRGRESRQASRLEPGHELDLDGLALGLERNVGRRQFGLIVAVETQEGDFLNSGGGGLEVESHLLQLYLNGQLGQAGWYGLTLGRGWHDRDTLRRLRYEDPDSFFAFLGVDALLPSRSDMREWSLQLDAGHERELGQGYSLGLQAGVDYRQRRFDAFAERGEVALRLAYAERSETSLRTRLGVELRRAISTGHGVLLPRLALSWQHELRDQSEQIRARFAEDLRADPAAVLYSVDGADRSHGRADAGLAWFAANGWAAHLGYRRQLSERYYHRSAWALTISREFQP